MKPYKTIRKRGEYFNDIGMIIEVLNAQTYKTIEVEEAKVLLDAVRELKRRIAKGKKHYKKAKKRGMTKRGLEYFACVKRARSAGRTYQEQREIERALT